MKSVLVPLDLSDASPAVVEQARRMARALKTGVLLLHVVEPVASYVPVGASMDVLAAPSPAGTADLESLGQRLEQMAAGLRDGGMEARAETVVGLAGEEILQRASPDVCEMIVMGSHGHGALYHLLSGSVVNAVLKRARVPVCIVPVGIWKDCR